MHGGTEFRHLQRYKYRELTIASLFLEVRLVTWPRGMLDRPAACIGYYPDMAQIGVIAYVIEKIVG